MTITNPLAPHTFQPSSEGSAYCGHCGDDQGASQHSYGQKDEHVHHYLPVKDGELSYYEGGVRIIEPLFIQQCACGQRQSEVGH